MNAGMMSASNKQHRRRMSMPSTPPETPLGAYFDRKDITPPPSHSTHISIYPDSPPITPERRAEEERKEPRKGDETVLSMPTHGARKPSIAYAHHRRTSTATIVRLAAARQGIVLTPSKVLTLFLIVFSATYLASFLPGPLNSLLHRRSTRINLARPSGAPSYYNPPTVSGALNNKPRQRSMPIGETAQRRAWENSFAYRAPAQQHVVPVKHDADNLARSYHGDLYRAHPELLVANTGSQPRRRPLRFGKEPEGGGGVESEKAGRRTKSENDVDSSFDDAARSPRQAAVPAERQAQLNRMKKMAVAKQGNTKVGSSVPLDSSQIVAEDERVHVEGGAGSRKKVKKYDKVAKDGEKPVKGMDATREGGKRRMGEEDRQVVNHESRQAEGARTVDEWAELEDPKRK
ncbi:uncharacterized protein JCM6883_003517 [Sporobolomyces salmoneus]|uniref:uncharacterized protein n=1 Tax=Sporobolomyces salmoneus TaxID=183962 RepID=UPI003170B5E8